jgi:hypothetical protein
MPRGFIRWEVEPHLARPVPGTTAAEAAVVPGLLPGAHLLVSGAEPLPTSDQPLEPRDEAVFLLHTAAEIEHALLGQYLYAAYSLGDRQLRKAEVTAGTLTQAQYDLLFKSNGWQSTIVKIAKEEMGHLLTVQNLLILIGGPLTFEREEFPFRSEFYPFPFALEPLTKDALAKFVAAERPPSPDPTKYPKVAEIDLRAMRANRTVPINQVGKLYKKLIDLFALLPEDAFFPDTVATYQARPVANEEMWGHDQPSPGQPGPGSQFPYILDWTFGGSAADAKKKACQALELIAQQGEGPVGAGMDDSHFSRFYKIYDLFPETNPRYGNPGWLPALPVPRHPSTAPYPFKNEAKEDGRITDPLARAWAHLFNLRYRMLLADLTHYLHLDSSKYPKSRIGLHVWAIDEMLRLPPLSARLTSLPRQAPNLYDRHRPAVAAGPFELPYALDLPLGEKGRWALHRSLLKESGDLITTIREKLKDPSAFAMQILNDMAASDKDAAGKIAEFEAETTHQTYQAAVAAAVASAAPATPEADMLALVAFLKAQPHNAANRHRNVDIGGGHFLSDLFADPLGLLTYLKTQSVVQDEVEAGKKLIVPGKPDDSAFFRIIQRAGHPMKGRFALQVPGVNKTGVQIVQAWILSLT